MSKVVFDFKDENFVVTGAGSGMGRQIAVELAQAGAKVLALDLNKDALATLSGEYSSISSVVVNVCDYATIEQTIQTFVETNGKLNGSVHAAGISALTPLRGYDEEFARKIMDISFWAGINLVRVVTKNSFSVRGSSNVLFSSVSALSGEKAMFAYAGTKAAMLPAVKSMAKELSSKGHRVNSVMPGWVQTPMTGSMMSNLDTFADRHLLGIGKDTDVSGVVLFLLSDRAKWITGSAVVVDGGYLA